MWQVVAVLWALGFRVENVKKHGTHTTHTLRKNAFPVVLKTLQVRVGLLGLRLHQLTLTS